MIHLACDNNFTDKSCEEDVDEEILRFEAYFRTIQSDGIGLTGPEVAIIKTFCAYLLGLGPNNPRNTNPPPTQRSEHA